jgi:serine/threonine protein kinase
MGTNCMASKADGHRMDRQTGQAVAIKIIDVENAEDEVDDIIQEISILSELNSPYVTKYHGSFLKGSDLWIVMEFCSGGSCADLMKPGLIPEEYIGIILRELLLGLEYLHGDNKLHRDIKGILPCHRRQDANSGQRQIYSLDLAAKSSWRTSVCLANCHRQ